MSRAFVGLMLGLVLLAGARGASAADVPDAVPSEEEASWLDDWSILPLLFYSPETAVGFGLAVIRSLEIPEKNPSVSTIALGVIYTTRGQLIARAEPDLRLGDRVFINGMVRYQRYPTRFFEPGAKLGDDGEPYDEKSLLGYLDGRVRLTGRLRAGLRWEYRRSVVSEHVKGGELESSGLPGLGSWFASGIGPAVSFDSRDEPRLPRQGVLIELRALGYGPMTGSHFDGLRLDLDMRGYLDLGHCHVLGAQLLAQTTSGGLPFQLLPRLGGANALRGWYEGHLRDRHALLMQLEWRFPIVGRVGGAAFFALGQAVPELSAFSPAGVRAGGGLGLRYLLSARQNVTVRFDAAWGSGFGAYFDVLEAF